MGESRRPLKVYFKQFNKEEKRWKHAVYDGAGLGRMILGGSHDVVKYAFLLSSLLSALDYIYLHF